MLPAGKRFPEIHMTLPSQNGDKYFALFNQGIKTLQF